MKIPDFSRTPLFNRACRAIVLASVSLSVGVASAADGRAVPSAPDAAKTHQLFIGLDVYTPLHGESARVRTIEGTEAELVLENDTRNIRVRDIVRYTPKHDTKVSTTRLLIQNTRANKASTRLDQMTRDMIVEQAIAEKEAKRQEVVDRRIRAEELAEEHPDAAADITNEFERRELVMQIREENPNAQEDLFSGRFIAYEDGMRAIDQRAAGDEVSFSFDVSSPRPLEQAHAVVLAGFKGPNDGGPSLHRVIMRPLPPLGPEPTEITLVQGGIPPDHSLESYSIHVYANGHELGSNLSAGSIDLTRDEAIQFMRLKHLREHARTDVGPTVMTDLLPQTFTESLPTEQRARRATITVNARGEVTAVALDRLSGSNDAYLRSLIQQIPFYPAVSAGTAVEGEITLQLADLML